MPWQWTPPLSRARPPAACCWWGRTRARAQPSTDSSVTGSLRTRNRATPRLAHGLLRAREGRPRQGESALKSAPPTMQCQWRKACMIGLALLQLAVRGAQAGCTAGQVKFDSGCVSCDAGKFSTSTDAAFCTQCASGKEQARPSTTSWRSAVPNRPTLRASTASCEIHGGGANYLSVAFNS